MKKRDRLEVIRDMLAVISKHNNEIKPTPLLRYANLSSQRFSEYFEELQEKQLILLKEDKKGRKVVSLTEKGFTFLQRYQVITTFIDDFNL